MPTMPILGFDADGPLINSKEVAWTVAEEIMGLLGPRPSIQSAQDWSQKFGARAQAKVAGEGGAPMLREFHRLVMRARADQLALVSDAVTVVADLAARPLLITAGYAGGVRRVLGPQASLFADLLGRENGAKELLIAEAEVAGMRWFVTDTIRDLRRCRDCGVRVIAVSWGFESSDALAAAAPDFLVHQPAELRDVLAELGFAHALKKDNGDDQG